MLKKGGVKMVYVTYDDSYDNEINIVTFAYYEKAYEFCTEFNLDPYESIVIMDY